VATAHELIAGESLESPRRGGRSRVRTRIIGAEGTARWRNGARSVTVRSGISGRRQLYVHLWVLSRGSFQLLNRRLQGLQSTRNSAKEAAEKREFGKRKILFF
jgi:hypothetical protein